MGGIFEKMIKPALKILLVLLAFAVLALPALFTNSVYGYLPAIFLAALALLDGVYLFLLRRRVRVIAGSGARCRRGEKVAVGVSIENSSPLACLKAEAELFLSDCLGRLDSALPASSALDAKRVSYLGFDATLRHVGLYKAGVKRLKLYGLFGIFSTAIPVSESFEILVLPRASELLTVLEDEALTDRNTVSYSENEGFDYTGVREYVYGDSMKRIHWKLSAHTSTYMTKINEVSHESDLAVILDMACGGLEGEALLAVNDALTETMASVVAQACQEELEYKVLYPDRGNRLRAMRPAADEDLAELISTLMPINGAPAPDALNAEAMLLAELQSVGAASNIIVCTAQVTDALISALIAAKEQRYNPILYRVIRPSLSPRSREEAASQLRLLDEYGISYAVISAEGL